MLQDKLKELLEPVINDLGYELWGLEYLPKKNDALLRIFIDKTDGIGFEDCERVSHQVSATLDVEDPIKVSYNLEISSPGLPKPLFYPWQFQRFMNQEIQLKLYQPMAGKRKIRAVIEKADDERISLRMDGELQDVPYSNIINAYLTFE